MPDADVVRTIEVARERLRRARAEASRVLGPDAVDPPPVRDLLLEPVRPRPTRAIVLGVGAAVSGAIAATLGPEIALAPLAAAVAVAVLGREPLSERAVRLVREMGLEVEALLAQVSDQALREVSHLVSRAGALDRAALRHAEAEPGLRARFASATLVCPSCKAVEPGAEFARWRLCPRCRSEAFLERVEGATPEPAVREALREYARWRDESHALARALAAARRIAEVARGTERDVLEVRGARRPRETRVAAEAVEARTLTPAPPPAR